MADPITPEDTVLTLAIKDMSFNPWQARPDVPRQQTPAQAYMAQRNHWIDRLQHEEPASLGIFVENYPVRTDFDGLPGQPRVLRVVEEVATDDVGVPVSLPASVEDVELTPAGLRRRIPDGWSLAATRKPAPETKRAEVLDTAKTIIHGDREKDYGAPIDSFTRLAEALNLVLRPHLKEGHELKPTDAVKLMIAMKLSRLAGGDEKDDTWVDLAGYSALGAEVRDQQ